MWFHSVAVITSALHAEGRGFEPRWNLSFIYFSHNVNLGDGFFAGGFDCTSLLICCRDGATD